jgi:hypothetical protein
MAARALAVVAPVLGEANAFAVDCKSPGQPVSPAIYGIAVADAVPELGATAHRWRGNTTSRYDLRAGNRWSSAHDWFWENQQIAGCSSR